MTFPKDLATPYSCIESVSITTSSFFLNRVFACPNLWTFTETHTHKHTHTKVWWKSVWWQLLNLIFTHSLFTDTPACTSLRSFTYHPTLSLSLLFLSLSLSLSLTYTLFVSVSVCHCLSVCLSLSLSLGVGSGSTRCLSFVECGLLVYSLRNAVWPVFGLVFGNNEDLTRRATRSSNAVNKLASSVAFFVSDKDIHSPRFVRGRNRHMT